MPTCSQIPFDVLPGSHRLLVEGLAGQGNGDILFTNETQLDFETKYMSVYIRPDHFEYYPDNIGGNIVPDVSKIFQHIPCWGGAVYSYCEANPRSRLLLQHLI